MVAKDKLRGVAETLADLERRMETAARRLGESLPEEPDLHEDYRAWRATLRRDAGYQAALSEWELVRWRYSERARRLV